jgi:outer membrane protein assembly factor BamB
VSGILFAVAWLAFAPIARGQTGARAVLRAYGRKDGLCVVIGCGGAAQRGLAADLPRSGRLLVHGIALDDASLQAARRAIANAGVEGLATVERLPVSPLPYRDNLANLIVVADPRAASAAGYTHQEAMRVLAPGGTLCVADDGKWLTSVKPMPADMDEWTHPSHGPDGNRVSADKVVRFPVGFRWHAGLPMNLYNPRQSGNVWATTRGLAVTGGRCFALSTSVLENLGPTFRSKHGLDHYVTARDAYNGLLLWRRAVGRTYYGGLFYGNRAPFAAVPDAVYVATGEGKLLALDAATGRTARTFDTTHAPGRLLVDGDVIVVATWQNGVRMGNPRGLERRRMAFAVAAGTVEAFDRHTGRRLWQVERLATSICSADDRLFIVCREGADKLEQFGRRARNQEGQKLERPAQAVVAVALRSGRPLWKVTDQALGAGGALRVDAAGLGLVAVCHDNGAKTSLLSAVDGKVIVKPTGGGYAAFHDGAVHLGGASYDPKTGNRVGRSVVRLGSTICTPPIYVNGIHVANRGGGFRVGGRYVQYGGARGGCLFGSVPAYGAFYTPQNWCACAPAQISGFIVFGPVAGKPTAEQMQTAAPVEKGPAFGTIQGPTSEGWPTYRHDARRSNATPADAPKSLEVLWQQDLIRDDRQTPLSRNWQERLADPLTAPTCSGGLVAVALSDRHQVVALDAETGAERWRAGAGGRIDSPATFHRGACLFGSHDGYVYALRAADGRLAWRMRVAPRQERMVSYGKVESPWPAIGTVLVADGMGYASAGRTQGSDGGIVIRAFDPANGGVAWSRAVRPATRGAGWRQMRRNDLLLKVGDAVQWMIARFDAGTGEPVANPTLAYLQSRRSRRPTTQTAPAGPTEIAPAIGLEGFLSSLWTRLGTRKYRAMCFGNVRGELVSWGERLVCATGNGAGAVLAYDRRAVGPQGDPLDAKARRWFARLPKGHQATAVVVCGNLVVVGGGVYADGEAGRGFVELRSLEKGAKVATREFDAPLSYNGIAVAAGRIYATFADGRVMCIGTPRRSPGEIEQPSSEEVSSACP